MRTFEDKEATRESTPLLLGIVGPSGTGKTYSALRLATGVQRICGGDIHVIDSEAKRALHYAKEFKFRHVVFGAPFSPLDYLAAIEHCVKRGAKTIIIDSMSHEHEGPGGVLELHEAELDRMCGQDWKKRKNMSFPAWQKPKSMRRQLINAMLQMDCNFILCFRAKEKLKLVRGEDPIQLGWMPIAGQEFVYEMTVKFLLLPGSDGVPVGRSEYEGERAMIKVPEQFKAMLSQPRQLSEDIGEELARWAAGTAAPAPVTTASLISSYQSCSDAATYRKLEEQRGLIWARSTKADKERLKAMADEARTRIEAQSAISDSSEYQAESTGDEP